MNDNRSNVLEAPVQDIKVAAHALQDTSSGTQILYQL